jgi:hypothetical protein
MNLRLIEKRFQHLELQANYLNYKYNPNAKKISGLSQHAYMEELRTDNQSDPILVDKNFLEQKIKP